MNPNEETVYPPSTTQDGNENMSKSETPGVVIIDDANLETTTESEVHILGVNQYVNKDSGILNTGFSTIDGEPIVMIDVDGDGVFDDALYDNKGNGQIDESEVLDISVDGIMHSAGHIV